jgi:hypothetical protein
LPLYIELDLMRDDDIKPEDVRGRSRVEKLAPENLTEAINVARSIRHPWYRCQSLTKTAEHSQTLNQKLQLLHEAFDVAQLQEDINRAVTVSAGPLRVLALLAPQEAQTRIVALVGQVNHEPHTLRRADALFALASAVQNDKTLIELIIPSLFETLINGRGWRIDRLIRNIVPMVKDDAPHMLSALVAHHTENSKRRQLTALLTGHGI